MTTNSRLFIKMAFRVAFIFIGIAFLSMLCAMTMSPKHQYELRGQIYKVDYEENITLITTDDGNVWSWKGYEVPVKGTRMILTMTDTGTPDFIYDDAIVSMRCE